MKYSDFERRETDPTDDIRALLQGSVFHVTLTSLWREIEASGQLLPNINGKQKTTFGSSQNSFFRKKGCVSLFDYRVHPTEEINDFRSRCDPLQPAEPNGEGISILIMSEVIYERLIPWTKWKEEEAYGEMVVPHVEVGHPGPIPIKDVTHIIRFRRSEVPHSLSAKLREAYARRHQG